MKTKKATYEDWVEARNHSWECNCAVCVRALDNVDPHDLWKFKDRYRRENPRP